MLIVFALDTSLSMNQSFLHQQNTNNNNPNGGPSDPIPSTIEYRARQSFLDTAKNAIEYFIKQRPKEPPVVMSQNLSRFVNSNGGNGAPTATPATDKFLLFTSDSFGPESLKGHFKDGPVVFFEELKNIEAMTLPRFETHPVSDENGNGNGNNPNVVERTRSTNPFPALCNALKFLHLMRLQGASDFFCQGSYPGSTENAIILYFYSSTENHRYLSHGFNSTLQDLLKDYLGKEYLDSPLRWDQSLFSFAFDPNAPAASSTTSTVIHDHPVCQFRGCHFLVHSQKNLYFQMDKLARSHLQLPSGVNPFVKYFFFISLRQSNAPEKKFICRCVCQNNETKLPCEWPFPESNSSSPKPTRQAQPEFVFSPFQGKSIPNSLSYDTFKLEIDKNLKLELDACPLQVLSVADGSSTYPIGFIRKITGPTSNLPNAPENNHYILQVSVFNCLKLSAWLEKMPSIANSSLGIPRAFTAEFKDYISTVPSYYFQSLSSFLRRRNVSSMFLEEIRTSKKPALTSSVANDLKNLKVRAKQEVDSILNFKDNGNNKKMIKTGFNELSTISSRIVPEILIPKVSVKGGPVMIRRNFLLEQLEMARNLLCTMAIKKSLDIKREIRNELTLHHSSISVMGDFMAQKYQRRLLRSAVPLENEGNVRNPFGSPYKSPLGSSDKSSPLVDEAGSADIDISDDVSASVSSTSSRGKRRSNTLARIRAMKKKRKLLDGGSDDRSSISTDDLTDDESTSASMSDISDTETILSSPMSDLDSNFSDTLSEDSLLSPMNEDVLQIDDSAIDDLVTPTTPDLPNVDSPVTEKDFATFLKEISTLLKQCNWIIHNNQIDQDAFKKLRELSSTSMGVNESFGMRLKKYLLWECKRSGSNPAMKRFIIEVMQTN